MSVDIQSNSIDTVCSSEGKFVCNVFACGLPSVGVCACVRRRKFEPGFLWSICHLINVTFSMMIIIHCELKVPQDEFFHCFLLIKILCVMFQASLVCPSSLVWYVALIATRLILLTLCGWVLCWTVINLFDNYSVLNLLFLGYP